MSTKSSLLQLQISAGYRGYPDVLRELELTVEAGEIVGLVDVLGMAKNMVALSVTRLVEERGGAVRGYLGFRGQNLMDFDERKMKSVRGREIATLLPSSQSPLNPSMSVGAQVLEAWRLFCSGKGNDVRPHPEELMQLVGLPSDPAFLGCFSAELTTDQLQRVRIAMAIVHKPALLIVDEPTRGLNPVAQMEILDVLSRLNRRLGMSILCLSRELVTIATICHRIAILKNGKVVETDTCEAVMSNPQHEHTKTLLAAAAKRPLYQKGVSAVA